MTSGHRPQQGITHSGVLVGLMLLGMISLLAVWLSSGLMGAEKWPIKWLEVDGPFERVNAEQVRGVLTEVVNKGFFAVDLNEVRQAARELPWVARVEARKKWPDMIHVRILEHHPVAHWRDDQTISDSGEAFVVPGRPIQGLPRLLGPEQRLQAVLAMWQEMRARLIPIGQDISVLELKDRGAWEVQLNSGIVLHLGREAVIERLHRFVVSWPFLEQLAEDLPVSVDLRYTNGFAVQREWSNEQLTIEGNA